MAWHRWFTRRLLPGLVLTLSGLSCAHALSISGLRPLAPLKVQGVQPRVEGKALLINVPSGPVLRITEWPAHLPQHFAVQDVTASRQGRPAGPTSSISLADPGHAPWLVLGSGTRSGDVLYGGWRLLLENNHWLAQKDALRISLTTTVLPGTSPKTAKATLLATGSERWCFYLLDSRLHEPGSREQEPQLDWAMVRLGATRAQCPASW